MVVQKFILNLIFFKIYRIFKNLKNEKKFFILGAGSNVLFKEIFKGVVLKLSKKFFKNFAIK